MDRLMLSLCAYDLVYLLASVTMFAVPLLYPGIVIHDAFTLSVPILTRRRRAVGPNASDRF